MILGDSTALIKRSSGICLAWKDLYVRLSSLTFYRILYSDKSLAQGPLSLWFCETRSDEPSPLLGGAEAKGFGVGAAHEEPTPALRDRCR